MKKIAISLLVTAAVAQAGMFSAVQGMTMDEVKPQVEYTLDTNGINPRIYEFTPKLNPKMTCVFIVLTGDEPSSTLQCYPKG